jgi:hypothetical protein
VISSRADAGVFSLISATDRLPASAPRVLNSLSGQTSSCFLDAPRGGKMCGRHLRRPPNSNHITQSNAVSKS